MLRVPEPSVAVLLLALQRCFSRVGVCLPVSPRCVLFLVLCHPFDKNDTHAFCVLLLDRFRDNSDLILGHQVNLHVNETSACQLVVGGNTAVSQQTVLLARVARDVSHGAQVNVVALFVQVRADGPVFFTEKP